MANNESVGYSPGAVPTEIEELPRFIQQELWKLQAVIEWLASGRKDVLHVEPEKKRDGMIVVADGTNWNPGGTGAGAYLWIGGAWVKL